jgi:hypothetical protein
MKNLATVFFVTVFCLTAIGVFAQNTTDLDENYKPATAVNYTDLVAAQQDKNTKSGELRVGAYIANVAQTTWIGDAEFHNDVEIKIKIDSVDGDGNVKGEFFHSTLGKGGKGGLTGKVELDSDFKVYRLQLKGSLISKFGDTWQVALNATVGDKVLTKGSYGLNGKGIAMGGNFKRAEFEADN